MPTGGIHLHTNEETLQHIEIIGKNADRLRETFRLHKEDVLHLESPDALFNFREYSRLKYQPRARELKRELLQKMVLIRADDAGYEVTVETAEAILKELESILGHIISTPNRLIRVYKARLESDRTADTSDSGE